MKPAEFYETLIDGEKTILHFSAVWCTPCRLMEPAMAEFLGDNQFIRYVKVDVDDRAYAELMGEFAVKTVPTIIAFDGRRKITSKHGALTKSMIESLWNTYD